MISYYKTMTLDVSGAGTGTTYSLTPGEGECLVIHMVSVSLYPTTPGDTVYLTSTGRYGTYDVLALTGHAANDSKYVVFPCAMRLEPSQRLLLSRLLQGAGAGVRVAIVYSFEPCTEEEVQAAKPVAADSTPWRLKIPGVSL